MVHKLAYAIWRPVYEETTRTSLGTVIENFVTEVTASTLRQAFWKAWVQGAVRIGDKIVLDPDYLAWQYIAAEDGIWSLDGKGRKYALSEEWTKVERMAIKALRLGLPI